MFTFEYAYAAKFVCGKFDGTLLAPGEYWTASNVHARPGKKPDKPIDFINFVLPPISLHQIVEHNCAGDLRTGSS